MADSSDRFLASRLSHVEHVALYRKNLRLVCPRCRTARILNAAGIWWLFAQRRWSDSLKDASRRFHCGACYEAGHGRIRPAIRVTDEDETPGHQLPPPPERDWRRLVSRYRS